MKFAVSAVLLLILSTAGTFSAFAMPAPAEITLRVDVRNLVGPEGTGKLDDQVMVSLIEKASMFWRPCGVRFMARSTGNVDAVANQVPYRPKNQDDLGKILAAMDPNKDHTGIPVMIAGPWDYKDASYGLYLWGLGWVFFSPQKVDRIGVAISANRLSAPDVGATVAHELGHALFLQHTEGQAAEGNLMGRGLGLNPDQCAHARRFAQTTLASFVDEARQIAAR